MLLLSLLEEVESVEKVNVCLPRDAMKAQRGKCQRHQSWGPGGIGIQALLFGKRVPPCSPAPPPPPSLFPLPSGFPKHFDP